MKSIVRLLPILLAAVAAATVFAAKPIPGPQGGKIVTAVAPHIEFFVTPERTVMVSFYDQDLKPVALSGQIASAVAEAKGGKVTLAFAARAGALVSTTPLPEGEGYRIVLQVRDSASARPRNYRIDFHEEICGECRRAEYACVCAGHAEGHDH